MDGSVYEEYKTIMALYLAPNSLSNRGRFCCAYCELVFTDQWALEKVKFFLIFILTRKEIYILLAFTYN
jgi:hypothetical protein